MLSWTCARRNIGRTSHRRHDRLCLPRFTQLHEARRQVLWTGAEVVPAGAALAVRTPGVPAASRTQLLREALSELRQQLERALEPNRSPQQGPHDVSFFPQKTDPRLRVSDNVQVGLTGMPVFYADLLILNHDSRLSRFTAGEGEMERGV